MPGLEFAGEVAEVGEGVTAWKAGDRVMAITSGEAQAEYVLADPYMLMRIPDGMSFPLAASIPEAGIAAHDALVTLGGMRSGWTVLLHAIGSGVATLGLQIAKAMGGWSERVTDPGAIKDAFNRARKATDSGRAALLEFVTCEEHTVSHLHEL